MPKGFATPTLPREPYETIKAWVDKRSARGLPTMSTPEIIQRLLWQFAAEVINDERAKKVVKEYADLENAFSDTIRKVRKGNNNP